MIATQTLKNAARAIEHDLWTDLDGANYLVKDGAIVRRWEPETSSADSFELMALLMMDVYYLPGFREVHACDIVGEIKSEVDFTDDLKADTRMAVLLCAAQIGESL